MLRSCKKPLILILLPVSIAAQQTDIKFEHLSLEHGLSQSTVRCIFQDSRGFMWFGTQDGLNRYDGYRFTIYKHDLDDPNSLSHNVVYSICEDDSGQLWIGTFGGGLNRFDRETETFTHFMHDPRDRNSLSGNGILRVFVDKSGTLWVGTTSGLNNLVSIRSQGKGQHESARFQRFQHDPNDPNSLSHNGAASIYEGQSGELWIGSWGGGLNRFDRESGTFIRHRRRPDEPYRGNFYGARDICEDESGNLWIATNSGLNTRPGSGSRAGGPSAPADTTSESRKNKAGVLRDLIQYGADPAHPDRLSNEDFVSICRDQSGILWIGSRDRGLYRFDPVNEGTVRYYHDSLDPNSLSHDGVYALYVDRSGILWIGTFGGGINKVYPGQGGFSHFKRAPGNPNSLSHNFVTAIREDRAGVLWVGTWGGGLNKIVRRSEENPSPVYTHFKHDPRDPNSLSSNIVLSVFEDRSGTIWIGAWGKGFDKYDPATGHFTHYQHDPRVPTNLDYNRVFSFHEDRSGKLWLGSGGPGLVRFDPVGEEFTFYRNDPTDPSSLSDDAVSLLAEDRSGVLWIGTRGAGLNRFDPETEVFARYLHDPGVPESLSNSNITCFCEDKSGQIWIGTWGGLNKLVPSDDDGGPPTFRHFKHDPTDTSSLGSNYIRVIHEDKSGTLWVLAGDLNKFDPSEERFIHYGGKQEFTNQRIHGILEGNDGSLWMSTHNGLVRFDPERGRFRRFDIRDGLQSNEFNFNAYFKSTSGEMFFGGVNGLNAFFPEDITDNPHPPQMAITDFQISNESIPIGTPPLEKSITETEEIVLSYRVRVFSFEFAALHFADPTRNEYAYMMEGLDEDWHHIGTRRFTTFTNLSPGEYTFRVKGSNSNGVWNEEGTSLRIIITPPWWKTWWAYALYLAAICAMIYGAIRFSTNRAILRRELELERTHAGKLEELDQMKSRFFANISHEFRTPLTLILGPLERMLADTREGRLRKQYRLMLRNGQRLLRLINQLLDFSKMEAGRMVLKARPENIVKLVESTVSFFSSMAESKGITLEFSAHGETITAYVDRDMVEKIVSNLLSNAFKFTPEGGRIEVAVGRGNGRRQIDGSMMGADCLVITVSDTGRGIPADRLERVFDHFYQVEDSGIGEQAGSGIGLALTRELVELHRGEISVDSPPPDGKTAQGTTFTVRLPLGKEHLRPEEVTEEAADSSRFDDRAQSGGLPESEGLEEKETPAKSTKDGDLILVVEDNRDVRAYLRNILEDRYQIIEAGDGVKGLEAAADKSPNLIISDVMMPEMDGIEFCRRIKTDEMTCHIPVILLTARASREDKLEGLETGADDYLTKPFDAQELLVRLRNLIEQRRRLRERFSREITVQPKDIAITSMDEALLQRAMDVVEEHMSDPEFTTDMLAREVGMSRMNLNRKLHALTDQTTRSFIRMLRLKRAAQLLQGGAGTVSEIVYDVGFNNLSHFAKTFRQQFGMSPSEFAASHVPEDL